MEGKTSAFPSFPATSFRQGTQGGGGAAHQGSHRRSTGTTLLPLPSLHCTQARRRFTPHYRSFKAQYLRPHSVLQNDQPHHSGRPPLSSELDHLHRHPRCLPPCTYSGLSSKISRPHDRRPAVLLYGTAVRPRSRPTGLHKSHEMASSSPPPPRRPHGRLLRRPPHLGHFRRLDSRPHQDSATHTGQVGFQSQALQMQTYARYNLHVARRPLGLVPRLLGSSFRQNQGPGVSRHSSPFHSDLFPPSVGGVFGTSSLRMSSPPSHATTFLSCGKTTMDRERHCQRQKTPRSGQSSDRPPALVRSDTSPGPHLIYTWAPNHQHMDRRLSHGLGSADSFRRHSTRHVGPVSHSRAHLHSRGSSGHPRTSPPELPQHTHPTMDRQRHSQGCHNKARQPSSVIAHRGSTPSPAVRRPPPFSSAGSHPVLVERSRRCPQQGPPTRFRMGPLAGDVRSTPRMARPSRSGSDGYTMQLQITNIRRPVCAPASCSHRRLVSQLAPMAPGVPLSTTEFSTAAFTKASPVPAPRDYHLSVAPHCTLVPGLENKGLPIPDSERTSASGCPRLNNFLHALRSLGRVEFLRAVWSSRFGTHVAQRLVTAHRASTNAQFQSAWSAFQRWLPASLTILTSRTVLEFLIFLQEEKSLAPRSVLTYRSALALPLSEGFGIDTSAKPFSLLARAQFLAKPPVPRIVPAWSLNKAFTKLSTKRFSSPSGSLEDLLLKTLFLVALASGNRASELAATTREGASIAPTSCTLPVRAKFLFKNQTLSKAPPPISFPGLGVNQRLCPIAALRLYLRRTSSCPHTNHIFVHPRSGKPLLAGRISYWLSRAIRTLAAPTGRFGGHDLRKMGHSLAWTRGVSLPDILRQGFWDSPNVFINTYLSQQPAPRRSFIAGRSVFTPQ